MRNIIERYLVYLLRSLLVVFLFASVVFLNSFGGFSINLGRVAIFSAVYLAASLILSGWRAKAVKATADYGQTILDILWILFFLEAAGGAESPFSLLFFLAILQAANVRFMRGAICAAGLASAAYGLILFQEYRSLVQVPGPAAIDLMESVRADYLSRGYIYAICFFIVAGLSGILAERLRLKGRQLEAAAKSWEEFRLSTGDILKKMGSGLLTVDFSGQVKYCNKTGAEILGLSEERMVGRRLEEIFSGPNKKFAEVLMESLRTESGTSEDGGPGGGRSQRRLSDVRKELCLLREDETEIPIGISTTPVRDAEGRLQGLIAVFQNLTEAKKIESRLKQMEQLEALGEHTQILMTMVQPMLAAIEKDIAGLAPGGQGSEARQIADDIKVRVGSVRKIIEDFMRYAKIEIPQDRVEDAVTAEPGERAIIGQSPEFLKTLEMVRQVAPTDSTVLLLGESGTGKELLAKEIHRLSRRSHGPFVSINCAALPETLLESELFGHVKGAFTGAVRDKEGLLRVADGGTFFLDEVSETSPAIQVKLLRVLQEREVVPVGGSRPIRVDIRLISATNVNLMKSVEEGKFRQDLYYRLNVIPINIPPLRERGEDIIKLAEYFIEKFSRRTGKPVIKLSERAENALLAYHWPGNVRELENAIERALVVSDSVMIELEDLPEEVRGKSMKDKEVEVKMQADGTLRETEKEIIIRVLKETGGNKRLASQKLGIHYSTLYRKLKQYGLDV